MLAAEHRQAEVATLLLKAAVDSDRPDDLDIIRLAPQGRGHHCMAVAIVLSG